MLHLDEEGVATADHTDRHDSEFEGTIVSPEETISTLHGWPYPPY